MNPLSSILPPRCTHRPSGAGTKSWTADCSLLCVVQPAVLCYVMIVWGAATQRASCGIDARSAKAKATCDGSIRKRMRHVCSAHMWRCRCNPPHMACRLQRAPPVRSATAYLAPVAGWLEPLSPLPAWAACSDSTCHNTEPCTLRRRSPTSVLMWHLLRCPMMMAGQGREKPRRYATNHSYEHSGHTHATPGPMWGGVGWGGHPASAEQPQQH